MKKVVSVRTTTTTTESVEMDFPVYIQYGDIHDTGGGYDVVTRVDASGRAVSVKRSYYRATKEFEVSVEPDYKFYTSDNIENATAEDFEKIVTEMVCFLAANDVLSEVPIAA